MKSRPVILCRELNSDQDEDLNSAEKSPPHITATVEKKSLEHVCIIGDGCTIPCEVGDDICDAIILLLGTYYIFDLGYPRIYSQILGFLQQYVLNDPYYLEKSADYKHFVAQYGNLFRA